MIRTLVLATLLMAPAMAIAQEATTADGTVQGQAPLRVRSLLLRAGEVCPKSTDSEVVVCSTVEEPYRIPKKLREPEPTAANRAWSTRVADADDVGRRDGGLPGTCSPIGAGGQTGCTQALLQQWSAERRAEQSSPPKP